MDDPNLCDVVLRWDRWNTLLKEIQLASEDPATYDRLFDKEFARKCDEIFKVNEFSKLLHDLNALFGSETMISTIKSVPALS